MDILGIPTTVWGFAALVIVVVWTLIWPRKPNVKPGSLAFFILRWFHALTWLLLAGAAFIAGFDNFGGKAAAQLVAFVGLITYLVFMATVLTTK